MSIFSIATSAKAADQAESAKARDERTLKSSLVSALGALSKWIPSEVLVGYAAAVAMSQPAAHSGKPSVIDVSIWVVALAGAVILTSVVAWVTAEGAVPWSYIVLKAGFAAVAFALWSATIPFSVWSLWGHFDGQQPAVLLGFFFAVAVFTMVAERVLPDVKSEEEG